MFPALFLGYSHNIFEQHVGPPSELSLSRWGIAISFFRWWDETTAPNWFNNGRPSSKMYDDDVFTTMYLTSIVLAYCPSVKVVLRST